MTDTQQSHPLAGATLGTEDRGDICIRNANGDLLYRLVPTLKKPNQPFDEVLRVALFNAQRFALRDKRMPDTSLQQAQAILAQLNAKVSGITAQVDELSLPTGVALRAELMEVQALLTKMAPLLPEIALPAATPSQH